MAHFISPVLSSLPLAAGNLVIMSRMWKTVIGKVVQWVRLRDDVDGVMLDHCFAMKVMMLCLAANSSSTFSWQTRGLPWGDVTRIQIFGQHAEEAKNVTRTPMPSFQAQMIPCHSTWWAWKSNPFARTAKIEILTKVAALGLLFYTHPVLCCRLSVTDVAIWMLNEYSRCHVIEYL